MIKHYTVDIYEKNLKKLPLSFFIINFIDRSVNYSYSTIKKLDIIYRGVINEVHVFCNLTN